MRKAYDDFVKKYGPINKEERTVTTRLNKEGEPVVITRYPNVEEFLGDPDAWKVRRSRITTPRPRRQSAPTSRPRTSSPRHGAEIDGPSDALAAVAQ